MSDNAAVRTYKYEVDGRKYERIIVQDDSDSTNPRTDWDNVGTMVCFHGRYQLGDRGHGYSMKDYGSWGDLKTAIEKAEKPLVIFPLYLMVHSGIRISTGSFNDPWDSGQVGFIFVSMKKAKETWPKLKGKKLLEATTACLNAEVETYDDYLSGNVYGYIEYEVQMCDLGHTHREETDSCFGFFGDIDQSGVLEGIPEAAVREDA